MKNTQGSHCGCCGKWMEGIYAYRGWGLCEECKQAAAVEDDLQAAMDAEDLAEKWD